MSSCGCNTKAVGETAGIKAEGSRIAVDLYYIDIDSCDRCQGASEVLGQAVALVEPALKSLGMALNVTETLVETAEQATAVRLLSSPSIRIQGHDIQADFVESSCKACSSLPNQSQVDCRTWTYRGETFSALPKGLIVEALLRAALDGTAAPSAQAEPYEMPANLRVFFKRKSATATDKSCGGGQCSCSG